MTTPEEIAARREAFEDDADNRRPDYPAAVRTIVTAVRDLAAVERERDELRAKVAQYERHLNIQGDEFDIADLRAEVERLSGPFRCCEHCDEDPIHDVETNQHELACQICDDTLRRRAEKAEATVARVDELAERWWNEADANEDQFPNEARAVHACVTDLRAALEGGDDE